jgi:hypothetical protein
MTRSCDTGGPPQDGLDNGELAGQPEDPEPPGALADQGGVLGSPGDGLQLGDAVGGLAAVVDVQRLGRERGGERERIRAGTWLSCW